MIVISSEYDILFLLAGAIGNALCAIALLGAALNAPSVWRALFRPVIVGGLILNGTLSMLYLEQNYIVALPAPKKELTSRGHMREVFS